MVELLRAHGGVVSADTAALFRQTELAGEMLAADDRGELPPRSVSPGRTLAEDLLEFGASGGAPDIVRMALSRITWPRDDTRWFYMLSRPLDFWNHIPWLSSGHQSLDRGTYIECFRQILSRCDPNLRARFGRTVLHEVAAFGDHVQAEEAIPFAVALLEAGARTDVRDDLFRSTPLGWACRWGRADIAKTLLDHGADPDEPDADAWARPRAWARQQGHTALVTLLDARSDGRA
jgi:ankyrin repeat protein